MGIEVNDVLHHLRDRPRLWGLGLAALALASLLGVVILVHEATWAGPILANGLRRVLGDRSVTRLEELWANAEDRAMRLLRRRAPPRELRDASPASAPLPAPEPSAPEPVPKAMPGTLAPPADLEGQPERSFFVDSVVPPFPEVAAPHDGLWYGVPNPERPSATPLMLRTLVHPDPDRSWAELFIVTLPISEIELRLVAGTIEPESDNPAVAALDPRGLIAAADEPTLLAAFNGGFRARHGHHGMITRGVTIVPMRVGFCTISADAAGALLIRSWRRGDELGSGTWYRQTPPCMLEQGVLHPGLANPQSRQWGATLEGETVIRRSAIALDRSGDRLYVGVSNFTTARALALGMQSAGGWTVAQLDVNWSYPKILIFPRDDLGVRHATSLFKGFLFETDEMLRRPSPRDFFYVVTR